LVLFYYKEICYDARSHERKKTNTRYPLTQGTVAQNNSIMFPYIEQDTNPRSRQYCGAWLCLPWIALPLRSYSLSIFCLCLIYLCGVFFVFELRKPSEMSTRLYRNFFLLLKSRHMSFNNKMTSLDIRCLQ